MSNAGLECASPPVETETATTVKMVAKEHVEGDVRRARGVWA